MTRASSEKSASTFIVACNLLSQYVKQKGAVADIGSLCAVAAAHGSSKGELPAHHVPPKTMSLFPGIDAGEGEPVLPETMDLFPQHAGAGLSDHNLSEPERGQLTIMYNGKVLVFENFPADKVKDLMQMAGQKTSPAAAADGNMTSPASAQVQSQKPGRPQISDLPIARKASLHRFLEKRKDRVNAAAPYRVTAFSPSGIKKEPIDD